MTRGEVPAWKGTKVWRVTALRQEIEEPDESLFERARKRLGVPAGSVARFAKRSVDARGRGADLHFVCQVDVTCELPRPAKALARDMAKGVIREASGSASLGRTDIEPGRRVVVVGAGPGGLFAALAAALSGAEVTLLERGEPIERRGRKVVAFHRGKEPDPETNLLFGDGGAGTYSDGKLYTRTSDDLEDSIIHELVRAGAPADIAFDARAHIGTDVLHRMLPRLRARLEEAGVVMRYGTRMDGLDVFDGPRGRTVRALQTSEGDLPLDSLVLAIGHSARDTWEWLEREGVELVPKPFQLGVRIEHPQELVTRGRYGEGPAAAALGPASYNLQSKGAPPAHSFCMCPGGRIVASVNEAGRLCTNGMSNSKHSSRWANAALVTTFRPEDYDALGFSGSRGGVEFQRALEERFFDAGGRTYAAPAQRASDFLAGRGSGGDLATSYGFGAVPGRVDQLLPDRARLAIAEALGRFERAIPGFAGESGLLVGVETRSSGPIWMVRGRDTRLANGWTNLLPAGEGAGYAGGIMSAAIDGARSGQAGAALPPVQRATTS